MHAQSRLVGNANDLVEEVPLKILSSVKAMKTLAKNSLSQLVLELWKLTKAL